MGDIQTLTVAEYRALSPFRRLLYRLYRNPVVLFGLGPGYLFYVQNRIPLGLMAQAKYWISAMGTNAAILGALALIFYFGGIMPILLIFLPSTLLAGSAGIWLFYVQHQFETAHWENGESWQLHEAALHGSSHYVLPRALQWLSANIGIHHVHHLHSRIPFYRLPEVMAAIPEVQHPQTTSLLPRDVADCFRLALWDTHQGKLVSFREARADAA